VYKIFTPVNYLASIVFEAKNIHGCFWTKMSVLAFVPTHNDGQKRVISSEVDESCARLGYYAAITGNSFQRFGTCLSHLQG